MVAVLLDSLYTPIWCALIHLLGKCLFDGTLVKGCVEGKPTDDREKRQRTAEQTTPNASPKERMRQIQ